MKRFLLTGIAVLGVNILIEGLAVLAFWSLLLHGDIVIVFSIGILALIGIIPQPWFLLFILLPYGYLYAFAASTVVTLFVYGWLDRQGYLAGLRQKLQRKSVVKGLVIGGSAVFALLITIIVLRVTDFPPVNHHAPSVLASNPIVIGIRDNRSYCSHKFIDAEYLWQARVTTQQMEALRTHYHMQPMAIDKIPGDFITMPPHWWQPKVTPTAHAYTTKAFPVDNRGNDGLHMMAIWDPRTEMLFMWVKDNF